MSAEPTCPALLLRLERAASGRIAGLGTKAIGVVQDALAEVRRLGTALAEERRETRAWSDGALAHAGTVNTALADLRTRYDHAAVRLGAALAEVERLQARVTELETPGECNSLHKLRAEVEAMRLERDAARADARTWSGAALDYAGKVNGLVLAARGVARALDHTETDDDSLLGRAEDVLARAIIALDTAPEEPASLPSLVAAFRTRLAQFRGHLGRDAIRALPQGKLLDALDAGRPDTSHEGATLAERDALAALLTDVHRAWAHDRNDLGGFLHPDHACRECVGDAVVILPYDEPPFVCAWHQLCAALPATTTDPAPAGHFALSGHLPDRRPPKPRQAGGFTAAEPTVPDGYRALPVEAWTNGRHLVVLGDPYAVHDDSEEDAEGWHSCDAMGCGTVGPHVLLSEVVRPAETTLPPAPERDEVPRG
jgi:hypothetical protein